jgi:hypothetical protein
MILPHNWRTYCFYKPKNFLELVCFVETGVPCLRENLSRTSENAQTLLLDYFVKLQDAISTIHP